MSFMQIRIPALDKIKIMRMLDPLLIAIFTMWRSLVSTPADKFVKVLPTGVLSSMATIYLIHL